MCCYVLIVHKERRDVSEVNEHALMMFEQIIYSDVAKSHLLGAKKGVTRGRRRKKGLGHNEGAKKSVEPGG